MIPDLSIVLSWLERHPDLLKGINRGIERETLRVTPEGGIAETLHPQVLGSALMHPWITTDFAEALLEFVTPVDGNVEHLLAILRDLHRFTAQNIGSELMWPLSMPCYINKAQEIILAQYGRSNIGRMKTIYREGLKNRYGAAMQTIAGIHYNFSLPLAFWEAKYQKEPTKEVVSMGYFNLIRNYYRFGWIIPYLFGASPALCRSFIKDEGKLKSFSVLPKGGLYLPYATSLRMSDLGYTNTAQRDLGIAFNDLNAYVDSLKRAIHTPSEKFAKIGVKVEDEYRQLNSNILQIENEFYAPIRPKRVIKNNESPSDALLRGGIEYIEVRTLDVNPFTAVGIDAEQVRFLDLFLIWCALAEAPMMSADELACVHRNWQAVILEGRKPGQKIKLGCQTEDQSLSQVGLDLFADFSRVAEVLDRQEGGRQYWDVCQKLMKMFEHPELTLSARTLEAMQDLGGMEFGLALARQYKQKLQSEPFEIFNATEFAHLSEESLQKQAALEESDTISFEQFLQQFQRNEKMK